MSKYANYSPKDDKDKIDNKDEGQSGVVVVLFHSCLHFYPFNSKSRAKVSGVVKTNAGAGLGTGWCKVWHDYCLFIGITPKSKHDENYYLYNEQRK